MNISGESVNVYTKNIYAKDERSKKWHDIGTFHIKIGMHSNTYDIQNTVIIKNTKHQIKAFSDHQMQAPHVFPEGYICHGTLSSGMTNAYKKRDLYQLVFQLILFLGQANTDDAAGKYVNCWPEVSEDIVNGKLEEKSVAETKAVEPAAVPVDKEYDEVFSQAIQV
jgi:hypothetical protein